jgi:hypothetical protein
VIRASAAALAAVLLSAGLTGCSSRTDGYCSTLEDAGPRLERLASTAQKPQGDVMADSLQVLEELRDQAPEEVADEWDTLVLAWDGMTEALDAAGAAPSAFASGERPDGVSSADYAAVRQAARQLSSTPVRQAAQGIEQHALDVCQVDLGGSL